MMIANRLSPKLRSALQQSIQRHGCRPMTIISKESAEQHKNMVRDFEQHNLRSCSARRGGNAWESYE